MTEPWIYRIVPLKENKHCTTLLAGPGKTDHYWIIATLGEAPLILGHQDETIDWYRQAAKIAGGRFGNVSTT